MATRLALAALPALLFAAVGLGLPSPSRESAVSAPAPRAFPSSSPLILERRVEAGGARAVEVVSQTISFFGLQPSMGGPVAPHPGIDLIPNGDPELLWVTGVRTEPVQAEADAPAPVEFFCHANLELQPEVRSGPSVLEWPLFTLVPGRLEIRLPEGFAIPVPSTRRLDLTTMALNLNVTDRPVRMRFKTRIDFVRDADLAARPRPLARRYLFGLVPLRESGQEKVAGCGEDPAGGCAGLPRLGDNASSGGVVPVLFGDDVTMHWLVPPGRHEYRTALARQLRLERNLTIHYATGHLHPYGTALEVRDRVSGAVVLSLSARDFPDRLGVAHVDERAFPGGLVLRADRDYDLVATYENPTERPVDAMAILYLFALDPEWRAPGAPERR